jgi:drug/metabolite transporter (DMT)-like permease
MRTADIVRLLFLAAIWGGSFIFMRVLAPVLGPVVTADLRVLIAGIALVGYFYVIKFDPEWRRYWPQYLLIGAVNSALPFFLFSFAALHIPASFSVILNSTSPLFGAIFATVWLKDKMTARKVLGLLVGTGGVVLIVKIGAFNRDPMFFWSIAACTLAAFCYGFTAAYIKKYCGGVKSMAIAGASQLAAGVILLPAIPLAPIRGDVTLVVGVLVVCFALLCSAVAYLLYYRLIADVGPTKALTVTFLMPVFGMFWGAVILSESVTWPMIAGTALIFLGTGLVLRSPLAGRKVAAMTQT